MCTAESFEDNEPFSIQEAIGKGADWRSRSAIPHISPSAIACFNLRLEFVFLHLLRRFLALRPSELNHFPSQGATQRDKFPMFDKPEAIDRPRGQVPVSRETGKVEASTHVSGFDVSQS